MTFGLKKTSRTGHPMIQINDKEFISARFVGVGGYQHREWKTRAGAEKAAKQFTDSEVFTITDTLNY